MSSWDRIRVQGPNIRKALLAGLIATIVLTALMYIGAGLGARIWNIPSIIAGAISFNQKITAGSGLWIWGLVMYVVFCVFAYPACYAYWMYSYLPGPTWIRGLIAGAFLWFLIEMLMMPLIGQGVFDVNGPNPAVEIISQLVLWLVYGAILGFIAGPQEVWRQRPHQERPA